jgi:hypothetical protein
MHSGMPGCVRRAISDGGAYSIYAPVTGNGTAVSRHLGADESLPPSISPSNVPIVLGRFATYLDRVGRSIRTQTITKRTAVVTSVAKHTGPAAR